MKRGKKQNYIQLTQQSALALKKKLFYKKQKGCCAVLKREIPWEQTALDHQHKRKNELPGPGGKGLIRGVLHLQVNSFEGKVQKIYKRYGLHSLIDLPTLLRNTADYLENPTCPQRYIHPNEKIKLKTFGIRKYKKIKKGYFKKYPKRKAFPAFPKNPKLTKSWQDLFDEINAYLEEKK